MRVIRFSKKNKNDNLLHIETEGCIVNIRVGLTTAQGNKVTSVEIISDSDYTLFGTSNNKIVKNLILPHPNR